MEMEARNRTDSNSQLISTNLENVSSPDEAGMEVATPTPTWRSTGYIMLKDLRMVLVAGTVAIAIFLTFYSKSGQLSFEGQVIRWKIFLFTLEVEAAMYVVFRDVVSAFIDIVLSFMGLTLSQISHAMGVLIPLGSVSGHYSYTVGIVVMTFLTGIGSPLLISSVLSPRTNVSNRIRIPDKLISTNCLGGRVGDNFGETGQGFLFNSSKEKYSLNPNAQPYVLYLTAGISREVFIPKTPQLGPYSADCNSNKDVDIVEAQVVEVKGILYRCNPKVKEWPIRITDFNSTAPSTLSSPVRVLKDSHKPDGNTKAKANFNVTLAIKKDAESTAVLQIPCKVTSAQATLDINMDEEGKMLMKIIGKITKLSLELPPRVLGIEPNNMIGGMENSIGAKSISLVEKYVATGMNAEWDGLVRAIVGAYGIRSARRTTFADRDEKRPAFNMKKVVDQADLQELQIPILWIPVALVIVSRILQWQFLSYFYWTACTSAQLA
eukprot:IDg5359t1